MLRGVYVLEKAFKGRPSGEGKQRPANRDWSMTQYALQVFEHLLGLGEPIPSHDAMKAILLFWMIFATIITGCTNLVAIATDVL